MIKPVISRLSKPQLMAILKRIPPLRPKNMDRLPVEKLRGAVHQAMRSEIYRPIAMDEIGKMELKKP